MLKKKIKKFVFKNINKKINNQIKILIDAKLANNLKF